MRTQARNCTYQRVNRVYARFVDDRSLTQRRSGQLVKSFRVLCPCAVATPLIHTNTNGEDDEEVGESMWIERVRRCVVDAVYHVWYPIAAVRILTAVEGVSQLHQVTCREAKLKAGTQKGICEEGK